MIHYPKHVGDWMKDTAHLSMLEEAAYGRLVDQYYTRERPLPVEPQELYRLARAKLKAERAAVDYVVATFFRVAADGLHQKRCDAEVQIYQNRTAKARHSARVRWQRTGSANAATDEMPLQCDGNANQEPRTRKKQNNVVVGAHATDLAEDHTASPLASQAQPEPPFTPLPEPCLSPEPATAERFAMHDGWRPGAGFAERLGQAGIAPPSPAQLTEFVSYRIGTGARHTQAVWEHKFLLRLEQLSRQPARRVRPSALAEAGAVDSPADRVRAAAARAGFALREVDHD